MREYRKTHPEYVKRRNKKRKEIRWQRKVVVLNHYSNNSLSCQCCGVNEIEFLTIDHVDGGGCEHRKNINIQCGNDFYKWLIDNSFPDGYRVLCFNCNCVTKFGNICPHQK